MCDKLRNNLYVNKTKSIEFTKYNIIAVPISIYIFIYLFFQPGSNNGIRSSFFEGTEYFFAYNNAKH